jgi:Fe2+ or Zn2+ uptake regulation protein
MENKETLYQTAHRKLTDYMVERNMRKTPERYEVLRIACGIKGIFTIDKLAERMEAEASFTVSRSTLFNVMEMLVDAQLIIKHTLTRAAHYEFNPQRSPLVCIVCHSCGSVKKLDKTELNEYLCALKVRMFAVQQPVLYLHGLCRKCSNIKKKKTSKKKTTDKPSAQKKGRPANAATSVPES